ncbi:MAG: DNA polymerase III subunit delta, partial [Verrucomicrobia bacterium]|nr:DNA polymerase III subunit delta [Verrucomicrobiota bacterium]
EDDFAVKQRAKEIFQKWSAELGGMDHETIDAGAANSGDSLKALAKLREALQTLPFFGGGKVVWLRDCNFLSDDRVLAAAAVTETLGEIAAELKEFAWQNVRLLISAGKVDKRKVFYKTVEKLGAVEVFAGLSVDDRDWLQQAEGLALREFRAQKKDVSDEALAELVARVGPNSRLLTNEVEKLAVSVGDRREIEIADVRSVCIQNKTARAFALGDALGDRNLALLLRRLDEELWEMKFDKDKSEIGLLYGLIGKVRALLFLKEMVSEGWLKPTGDYNGFKAQLERVPKEKLPADRRFNPLALNPYVLFKALPQARQYTQAELVRAMDLLLQCNRQLVSSGLDGALILQQALIKIVGRTGATSLGRA